LSNKRVLLGLSLTFLLGLLLSACNGTHPEQPPNPTQIISRGHQIYVEYCAECHQIDGSGWSHLYPKLAGNPIVTLSDTAPIVETVLYGQGAMPAFRIKLPGDDIAAVLSYIRNSWGNTALPVSPRSVH
jgi:mono/diheme cytochrome c family protein